MPAKRVLTGEANEKRLSAIAIRSLLVPKHLVRAALAHLFRLFDLIASMILERDLIGDTASLISREAFYQADHQIIYDVLLALYDGNKPVDVVILRDALIKRGLYEEVGGKDYLTVLLTSVPSAAHGLHYAQIVADKWMLRQAISASNDTLREAYEPRRDPREVIAKAEERIFAIAEQRVAGDLHPAGSVAMAAYESFESPEPIGLKTGYYELDDRLCGLKDGDVYVMGARPSMGKTALAMNIVENVAVAAKVPVPTAVFSMEMGELSLMQRFVCTVAEVDSQRARHRRLTGEDFRAMTQAVTLINKAPLYLDESTGQTILDLRAKCRRLKKKSGLRLVVIDYVQLMDGDGENRIQQLSKISRGIKALAREVNCPVLLLAQLNRNAEVREGQRPRSANRHRLPRRLRSAPRDAVQQPSKLV